MFCFDVVIPQLDVLLHIIYDILQLGGLEGCRKVGTPSLRIAPPYVFFCPKVFTAAEGCTFLNMTHPILTCQGLRIFLWSLHMDYTHNLFCCGAHELPHDDLK